MTLNGRVAAVDAAKAKVTFPDRGNAVTPSLPVAAHVGVLQVGDHVAVVFFSDSMADGLIIAKY